MKYSNIFLIIIIILLTAIQLTGQEVPYGINYQAVARDNYGDELTNKQIDIRFSVLSGTPLGNLEYQEVHTGIVTSKYGVFSVIAGQGTPVAGDRECFSDIDWGTDSHFLKVEIRFGTDFSDMGTMQFLSVPYALYAAKSLEPGPAGPVGPEGVQGPPGDPATDDQVLSFEGENLSISGGNTVNLSVLANDPNDEIQFLYADGDSLGITGGNKITLAKINIDDADANPENEIQDVWLLDDILKISDDPNVLEVDLSKYLDNSDSQELGFNSNTKKLYISNVSDSVSLSSLVNDADADPINEIQDLSLTGNLLAISNSSQPDIDLSGYLDDTDEQELDYDSLNYELTIGGGNSVKIGSVIAFRASLSSTLTLADDFYDNLVFDNTTDPNNIANLNYDPVTGIFTAPCDGLFSFTVTSNFGFSDIHLKINKGLNDYEKLLGPTNNSGTFNVSVICKLVKEEQISIWIKQTNGIELPIPVSATFSGFRVY